MIHQFINLSIAATLTFTAIPQHAEASDCLRDATDSALLDELRRRLDEGGGGGHGAAIANFSCNSWDLNVDLITPDGQEYSQVLNLGTSSNCQRYRGVFVSRVQRIEELTIIAACNSWTLHRFALLPRELRVLQERNMGTSSRCEEEATLINGNI